MMHRHGSGWQRYFDGKHVWVTGASSGIGAALVEALGAAGVRTLASARRTERLEQLTLKHASVSALPLDLLERERIGEIAARAWEVLGGIDVMINNAGISQRSTFVEADPSTLERVIQIDLIGTMWLTHAVAARMKHRGSGHLVAVTSLAAMIPTPRRTAYAAAKAGLHGLYDAMRGELEPSGIAISLAAPGFVRTEISTHAVTETGAEHGVLDPNQERGDDAASCAAEILCAVAKRKREFLVSMSPRLRLALLLRRHAPGLLWRILAKASVT